MLCFCCKPREWSSFFLIQPCIKNEWDLKRLLRRLQTWLLTLFFFQHSTPFSISMGESISRIYVLSKRLQFNSNVALEEEKKKIRKIKDELKMGWSLANEKKREMRCGGDKLQVMGASRFGGWCGNSRFLYCVREVRCEVTDLDDWKKKIIWNRMIAERVTQIQDLKWWRRNLKF